MVFSGLYPIDGSDYPTLRDALDKLQLNDAALVYEPETSGALGFGFRCGFLGLLHLEIVRERLEREFDLDLISTAPNVVYEVTMEDGSERHGHQPERVPRAARSPRSASRSSGPRSSRPSDYIGAIMELCQSRRGTLLGMDYLSEDRVEMRYTLPLAEIVFDFFDQLKSRTTRLRLARLRAAPASRRPTWSRSTSCCRASRSTRSARSCTRTRRTPTA